MELLFIVLSPTIGALVLGFLYLSKSFTIHKNIFTFIALSTPLISFILSLKVFLKMLESDLNQSFIAYKWLRIANFDIDMGFMADHLSIFMALFVSLVAWLIHVYATGYMKDDECYGKFFFYFNLFLASMLLLVLASSPIIMFIGWEGVGICSYFLISYYYKDRDNVTAGNKAFLVNRVGDASFIMGMCTLFFYAGQGGFDFTNLSLQISNVPNDIKIFIGITLFVGAMAKSAQIPLYVWLPDAMAGPTPVSALIHAATMVTAGVYMVSRFAFLYNDIPQVGIFIAYVGAFSSLLAAIIATKQTDIKKILAYSTMSQLGYMFVAVGLENYSAGMFHVFTHAFFKALLFMGAGAVIVALHHEQDIFKMGGLKKELKVIYIVMMVGCLAISGIPPFSGFFSKDEILFSAFVSGNYFLWSIEIITAFLTAFYMFRLFFLTFNGKNSDRVKAKKVPFSMIFPLIVLAFGATFVGFFGLPETLGGSNLIYSYLGKDNASFNANHEVEYILICLNILVGISGIFLAYKKYASWDYRTIEARDGLIYNKFYIDEIYDTFIVSPLRKISSFLGKFIDLWLIDGTIMRACKGLVKMGVSVAILQNANIRAYVFAMAAGLGAISFYLLSLIG